MGIVVIGASRGGARALQVLLSGLPAGFPLPVAIVQHRGRESGETLAARLAKAGPLPLSEPEDKEEILPSRGYLAPADYHLLVEPGWFSLSTEEPVNNARPSIDVLFESARFSCGGGVIGVILSGASADGARGAAQIKRAGGIVLVQDPDTAEAGAMPQAALSACVADRILPLEGIAPCLVALSSLSRGGMR